MDQKQTITFDEFFKIDLRVAKVTWAEEVEGADRLLKLKLDVGELGVRTIVAGVKEWYSPDDMVGKLVIYMANLEPKKIRGVKSQGMLVAAAPFDKETNAYSAVLINPDSDVEPGTILR